MGRMVFLYCLLPIAPPEPLVFRLTKLRRIFYANNERLSFRTASVDRRPLHDPHRPLDITDYRYVTRRSAPEPGNPYSAAHRLERAEPFRLRGGHQDDTPVEL